MTDLVKIRDGGILLRPSGRLVLPVSASSVTREKLEEAARRVLGSVTKKRKGRNGELIFLRHSFWELANGLSFELQGLAKDETIVRIRYVAPPEVAAVGWTLMITSCMSLVGLAMVVSLTYAGVVAAFFLATVAPALVVNRRRVGERIDDTMNALEEIEW